MDKFSLVLPAVVFLVTAVDATSHISKDILNSEASYASANGNTYSDNAQNSQQFSQYSNQPSSYQPVQSYSSQSVYVSPNSAVPNYGQQSFGIADTIQPPDYETPSSSSAPKSTKKTVILAIPVKLALQLPDKGQAGDKQEGQGYDSIGQAAAIQSAVTVGKPVQSYTGLYGSSLSSSESGKSYSSSQSIDDTSSAKSKSQKNSDFDSKPYGEGVDDDKGSDFTTGKLYTKSKGFGKNSHQKDSDYLDAIDDDDWHTSKLTDAKGIGYESSKGSANGNDNIDAIISALGTPSMSSLSALLGGKSSAYGSDMFSGLSGDFGIGSSPIDYASSLYDKPMSLATQNILQNLMNSYSSSYSSLLKNPSAIKGIDKGFSKYPSLINYGAGSSVYPLSYGSGLDILSNYGNVAPAVSPLSYSSSAALFGKPKKSKLSGIRSSSGFDLLKLASVNRPSIISSFGSAFASSSPAKYYSPLIAKAGVGNVMQRNPLTLPVFTTGYKSPLDELLGMQSSHVPSTIRYTRPSFSSLYRKFF